MCAEVPEDRFEAAKEALLACDIYPMFTPAHRAAAQRALQELKRAASLAVMTNDETRYADLADRLVRYLSLDWSVIDIIEVRRADGTTSILDLRDGQISAQVLAGVTAFRVIAARDEQ